MGPPVSYTDTLGEAIGFFKVQGNEDPEPGLHDLHSSSIPCSLMALDYFDISLGQEILLGRANNW
jgi:hypothetical protein